LTYALLCPIQALLFPQHSSHLRILALAALGHQVFALAKVAAAIRRQRALARHRGRLGCGGAVSARWGCAWRGALREARGSALGSCVWVCEWEETQKKRGDSSQLPRQLVM